jgi:hypothetical protein
MIRFPRAVIGDSSFCQRDILPLRDVVGNQEAYLLLTTALRRRSHIIREFFLSQKCLSVSSVVVTVGGDTEEMVAISNI